MNTYFAILLGVVLALAAGCVGATPSPAPVLPAATPIQPTATPAPPTATATLSPTNTPALTNTPKPTATATLVPPLSGSGGGRIVFASKRDDNYDIYVMNADGTDQRRLTNHPREDGRPAWSPDCRQIAFGSDRAGHFDIYVMNSDGLNVLRLTTKGDNGYPAWSPALPGGGTGGAQITFSRYDPGSDLYVTLAPHVTPGQSQGQSAGVNADGTNQQRLTQTGVGGVDMDIFDPAWSPDGTQMVCVVDSNPDPIVEESVIYVLNVRDIIQGKGSTHLWPLPRAGELNDNPTWSPKGAQIAFSAEVDGHRGIYVVNADGANLRRLTQTKDYDEFAPAWSPDGTQIVYQANPDGNWDIYIMNADGTGRRRLTTDTANDVDPDWCP
jgi:Tol biopolymer transport system component